MSISAVTHRRSGLFKRMLKSIRALGWCRLYAWLSFPVIGTQFQQIALQDENNGQYFLLSENGHIYDRLHSSWENIHPCSRPFQDFCTNDSGCCGSLGGESCCVYLLLCCSSTSLCHQSTSSRCDGSSVDVSHALHCTTCSIRMKVYRSYSPSTIHMERHTGRTVIGCPSI